MDRKMQSDGQKVVRIWSWEFKEISFRELYWIVYVDMLIIKMLFDVWSNIGPKLDKIPRSIFQVSILTKN